jgi:S1-C subfamily serine protease
MAARKTGLLGSLRNKIFALLTSVLATGGATSAFMYWERIVEMMPQGQAKNVAEKGTGLIKELVSASQKTEPTPKEEPSESVELLGCRVVESESRVRVAEVPPGSTAALLGLVPGDIIEEVDSHRITSAEALTVRLARSGRLLASSIEVRRGNASLHGEVTLASDTSLRIRHALR